MGITINGASPVFVEPDEYDNIDAGRIEAAVTPATKAILAVHLFGQTCDMNAICQIVRKYGLRLVEGLCTEPRHTVSRETIRHVWRYRLLQLLSHQGSGRFR